MSIHMRALPLGTIAAILIALLTPFAAQAAPAPFTWGSFSPKGATAYGVYDADNAAVLQTGQRVQLIYAGPDGKIDPPSCDGQPGGDDEVLQVSAVQNRGALPAAAHNRGYVPFSTYTFDTDDPLSGGAVYIRAWNTVAARPSAESSGLLGRMRARDKARFQGPVWGDSEATVLTGGAVFNASRWRTNQRCNSARATFTSLLASIASRLGAGPAGGTLGGASDLSVARIGMMSDRTRVAGLGASSVQLIARRVGDMSSADTAATSNRAAATTSSSWSLMAWPLLPPNIALDGVLGTQLHGTGSPLTADRVLLFNGATQSYSSAWFCGGPECVALGAPEIVDHWLNNDYELSSLTLPPDAGFWIENRSGEAEKLSIVGDVAAAERVVPVGTGWQLLGSAIPVARGLDQAGFPATGSGSPMTADRVLVWNGTSYSSAWFCGGPECVALGAPEIVDHWLNNDYEVSPIVLEPGHGFWYQNRHAAFTWTNPLPE